MLAREEISFTDLKNRLGVTDGNLDAHLKKFAAAGFLHSQTVLKGRSNTVYHLSPSGMKAFESYCLQIRGLLGG
ncbi:winged helix DNA-binding protein [Aestuariispira insulae]|uniref:Winged helix DNA-binding protein n=1 Tax=Aestuariispira insulae TaxID=1461337 RepID=A0A3D9H813_9PROT|nr:winged helix DNA-binding protein [Aestuariispira insulae]